MLGLGLSICKLFHFTLVQNVSFYIWFLVFTLASLSSILLSILVKFIVEVHLALLCTLLWTIKCTTVWHRGPVCVFSSSGRHQSSSSSSTFHHKTFHNVSIPLRLIWLQELSSNTNDPHNFNEFLIRNKRNGNHNGNYCFFGAVSSVQSASSLYNSAIIDSPGEQC